MLQAIVWRIGVVVLAACATFALTSGIATANDPYTGKTFAYAAGKVSEKGGRPVVSTVVGDQLATQDCIVTSWRKATYAATDNFEHGNKDYLFALNCSAKLAAAGLPGNSLASEQGRAEKAIEVKADHYNSKPERCAKSLASCQRFCEKNAGMCSKEVTALFA